jgi:hypothetical protein
MMWRPFLQKNLYIVSLFTAIFGLFPLTRGLGTLVSSGVSLWCQAEITIASFFRTELMQCCLHYNPLIPNFLIIFPSTKVLIYLSSVQHTSNFFAMIGLFSFYIFTIIFLDFKEHCIFNQKASQINNLNVHVGIVAKRTEFIIWMFRLKTGLGLCLLAN